MKKRIYGDFCNLPIKEMRTLRLISRSRREKAWEQHPCPKQV